MVEVNQDIRGALQGIDDLTKGRTRLFSEGAIRLLLGTAAHESGGLKWRVQRGGGPARGIFQMEKAYDDLWNNYLAKRAELANAIALAFTPAGGALSFDQITHDDAYAAVMARLRYAAGNSAPLPDADDLTAQAEYWRKYYNRGGAADVEGYRRNYRAYVAPILEVGPPVA
jgi:hypothetical protein